MSPEYRLIDASSQLSAADLGEDHDGDVAVLPDGIPPNSIIARHFFGVGRRRLIESIDLLEVA